MAAVSTSLTDATFSFISLTVSSKLLACLLRLLSVNCSLFPLLRLPELRIGLRSAGDSSSLLRVLLSREDDTVVTVVDDTSSVPS